MSLVKCVGLFPPITRLPATPMGSQCSLGFKAFPFYADTRARELLCRDNKHRDEIGKGNIDIVYIEDVINRTKCRCVEIEALLFTEKNLLATRIITS